MYASSVRKKVLYILVTYHNTLHADSSFNLAEWWILSIALILPSDSMI